MNQNRIGQFTHLTKAAAAAARQRLSPSEENAERAKQAIAAWMADARGVPTKVGQFLAGRDDSDTFASLLENLDPIPLRDILPEIDSALGRPHTEVFASIDESTAAASLGQVHKATLTSGETVAVKVQYPGIFESVQREMNLLGLLPGMGPVKKWGFDLAGYKEHFNTMVARELDYLQEAVAQERFRSETQIPGLLVPEVHTKLTTSRMLVQQWADGMSLDSARQWPEPRRKCLGKAVVQTFFTALFRNGHIHGDPHLGNIKAQLKGPDGNPRLVLMDFGCTLEISRDARLGLLHLILGAVENRPVDSLACFLAMGFDADKLAPIANQLPAVCSVLLEPFTQRGRVFNTGAWYLGERLDAILGELKWWFRSAGPSNLFLLMRAFAGLTHHLKQIDISVNWNEELYTALDEATLRLAREFRPPPVPATLQRDLVTSDAMAQFLKVQVTENGRQVVSVTMPATQVANLRELMPEETMRKVEASGTRVDEIARAACASGIVPQSLFSLEDDDRIYKVWLE